MKDALANSGNLYTYLDVKTRRSVSRTHVPIVSCCPVMEGISILPVVTVCTAVTRVWETSK